jgi:tetratricopeptide (TPR) repeat protein
MIEINLKARHDNFDEETRLWLKWRKKLKRDVWRRLEAEPENPLLRCEAGEQLLEFSDIGSAVQHFETAIVLDPNCGMAYLGLADCIAKHKYTGNRDKDNAKRLEFLKKGVRLCPTHRQRLWDFVKESTGSEEKAHLAVMEALEGVVESDYETAHLEYADWCISNERVDAAIDFYRKAMQRNPRFYRKLFVANFLSWKLQYPRSKVEEELERFRDDRQGGVGDKKAGPEAWLVRPPGRKIGNGTHLSDLGDLLFGGGYDKDEERITGEFDASVEDFEKQMAASPFNPHIATEYARYLAENWVNSRFDIAARRLRHLVRMDPSNPALRFEYGKFLIPVSEEEALKQLIIAYEYPDFDCGDLVVGNHSIKDRISMHYYEQGDYGKAKLVSEDDLIKRCVGCTSPLLEILRHFDPTDFDHAVRVATGIRDHHFYLHQILLAQAIIKGEKFGESNSYLNNEEMVEKIMRIPELKKEGCVYLLAKELSSFGLYDEAIEVLESVREKASAEYFLIGESYEMKWQKERNPAFAEKAHEAYSEAARHDPLNMDYVVKMAYTAMLIGDRDRLVSIWRYARTIADDESEEQLRRIEGYIGDRLETRLLEVVEEEEWGRRIDMLKELDREFPSSAESSLTMAYREYAPIVAEKMEALLRRVG